MNKSSEIGFSGENRVKTYCFVSFIWQEMLDQCVGQLTVVVHYQTHKKKIMKIIAPWVMKYCLNKPKNCACQHRLAAIYTTGKGASLTPSQPPAEVMTYFHTSCNVVNLLGIKLFYFKWILSKWPKKKTLTLWCGGWWNLSSHKSRHQCRDTLHFNANSFGLKCEQIIAVSTNMLPKILSLHECMLQAWP